MIADLSFINSGNKVLGINHQESYIYCGQIRNIFERVQLTAIEEEKINQLIMVEHGLPKSQLLRFLHAFRFNVQDVIQYIPIYKCFEDNQLKIQDDPDYGQIELVLKSGFIYIGGKDNLYRPIIIIKTELLHKGNWTFEIVYKSLCHFFYSIKLQVLQDYFVEQWVILLKLNNDLNTFSNLEVIENLKRLSTIFSGHLFRLFIFDPNEDGNTINEKLYFSIACINYRIINQKAQIDDQLVEKIKFVTDPEELENYLPMEQIEANALNYVKNNNTYWPPLQNMILNQTRQSFRNLQLKTQSTNGNNKEQFQQGNVMSVLSSVQDNSSLIKRVSLMKVRVKEESGLFLFDKDLIVGNNSYDDLDKVFDQNDDQNIVMVMSEDSVSEFRKNKKHKENQDDLFQDDIVNSDDEANIAQKSYNFEQRVKKHIIPLKEDSNQSYTLFTTFKYSQIKQTEQTKSQIELQTKQKELLQREPSLEDENYIDSSNQIKKDCCDYSCQIF